MTPLGKARRTGPSARTVRVVRERDDWRCVRCAAVGLLSTQHRIARGMGGSSDPRINQPSNLITLCGSGTTGDHGWVEAHPDLAKAVGLACPRWADPTGWGVWTRRGWLFLDNDGAVTEVDVDALPQGQRELVARFADRAELR